MTISSVLPLVYSCSGCSNAAQMTNYLALRLNREGLAEMSCIAGVGGGIEPLVRLARQARSIVVLDGCHLLCASACLKREGLSPTLSLNLADYGVRKRRHAEFEPDDAKRIWRQVLIPLFAAANLKPLPLRALSAIS